MRLSRFLVASIALAALGVALLGPSGADASSSLSKAQRARAAITNMDITSTNMPAALKGTSKAASYNWSGYAAVQPSTGTTTYTAVSTSYTQPSVTCSKEDRIAVFWAGLDGWTSSTVEQAGTLAQCFLGTAFYYTWWEMYPANNIQLVGSTVHPGDQISASISFASGKYTLAVTDSTTSGNNISTQQACSGSPACLNNSAEVIAERPGGNVGTYPLAQFSLWTANSVSVSSTTVNGTMTSFANDVVTMRDGTNSYVLAKPSAFNTTSHSFTDKWANSY